MPCATTIQTDAYLAEWARDSARADAIETWAQEKAERSVERDSEGRFFFEGSWTWHVECLDGRWYVHADGDVVEGDEGHATEAGARAELVELAAKDLESSDPDDDELYGYDDGDRS